MTNAEARFSKSLRPRKPEGSLGRTAQDVHLDSHTAPELCDGFAPRTIIYRPLTPPTMSSSAQRKESSVRLGVNCVCGAGSFHLMAGELKCWPLGLVSLWVRGHQTFLSVGIVLNAANALDLSAQSWLHCNNIYSIKVLVSSCRPFLCLSSASFISWWSGLAGSVRGAAVLVCSECPPALLV